MNKTYKIDEIANACLNYLISCPNELNNFMKNTGFSADFLRNNIGKKNLNQALFDYFINNEAALISMCAMSNFDINEVIKIWQQENKQDF